MKRSNSFGLYAGLALLVGAVALIIIAPWQTDHSTNPQTGLETVKIAQWGQERYLIYLPMYVAIEKGYFKDAGLDVTLTFTGNDDQTFAAALSRSVRVYGSHNNPKAHY